MVALLGAFLLKQSKCSVMKMTALSWNVLAKYFEKYQQEDRHSRYLQEHEKSRSIFPASHVGDRGGTEEGYQDTDLFVDESVDTAEQAIQNLLLEDLHQALLKLSPAERDFIFVLL